MQPYRRSGAWFAAPLCRQSSSHSPMAFPEDGGALVEERSASGTERLWRASQWWNSRGSKKNPNSPAFQHRIDRTYNPDWCQAQDGGLVEDCSKTAADAQELLEKNGWETLSLEEALTCMEWMPEPPSFENLTCILHKCRTNENLAYAKRFYAYVCKIGLEDHRSVGNNLVLLLVQVGSMCDAQQVFNKLGDRNVYSWTSLIWGYIELGDSKHALNLYRKMEEDSVHPSKYTFVAVLKACARLKDAERGREVHVEVARRKLERDRFVGNTMVDMYAKCGMLAEAREMFDKMPVRDEVSWTALMAGYAEQGLGEEALNCLEQMQLEGLSPNAVTFLCGLKACGSIGALDKGREMHTDIARKGLETGLAIGSTLVDMYAKCGSLADAQAVFDKVLVRDEVLWNALIAGYAEYGFGEETLKYLDEMQLEGFSPDAVTFVCSLKACGSIGAIDKGREIHGEIVRKGLEMNLVVGNSLVDMYAKCGSLGEAWEGFNKLPDRNEISWNALSAGYAQQGESEIVFQMLDRMRGEGIEPNEVTFITILTVCRHTGQVDKGHSYFEAMSRDYGITPTIKHHRGMVDLLGRAGQLDQATAMVMKMPFHPDIVAWHTVLGACQNWGNVEVGRLAFEHAVQLDEKDAASYVLMSNISHVGSREED